MTILTHAALGMIIGKKQKNLWRVAFLAYLSHFLLDAVPHNDFFYYYLNHFRNIYLSPLSLFIAFVSVAGLTVSLVLNKNHRLLITAGGFFAILPDALSALYYETNNFFLSFFDKIHFFFHSQIELGTLFYSLWAGTYLPPYGNTEDGFRILHLLNSNLWGNLGLALESAFEIFVLLFLLRKALRREST